MSKAELTKEHVAEILDHISSKSLVFDKQKIPPYAHGYLLSVLTNLADASPKVRKAIHAHALYVRCSKLG